MDAIGLNVGGGYLQSTGQIDQANAQIVAVGAGATSTTAFTTGATVVMLRANVGCWYRVAGTAAANTAGSDYLPANLAWTLKIPSGATISFIQATVGGYVAVTPMAGSASLPGPVPGPGPGPAPPLDSLPAALGGYSFRKLRTAYAGMCMNVMRSSDSTFQDIGFDASGNFNVAAFNTFVGAGSGSVNTWYDQTTNANNLAYNTAAARPAINLTGLNGKPTIVFSAANQDLEKALGSVGQPFTDNAVGMRTGTFTALNGIFGDQSPNGSGIYFSSAANNVLIYAGTLSANVACSDNVAHTLIGVLNGSSSTLTVDGATTSGLSVGADAYVGIKFGNIGNWQFTGNASEGIRWGSTLSGANITALAANQKAYWGTP